jgi:hypothetical protein
MNPIYGLAKAIQRPPDGREYRDRAMLSQLIQGALNRPWCGRKCSANRWF